MTAGKRLRILAVRRKPGEVRKGILACGLGTFPCALGRTGTTARKREGDGATPIGRHRLLYGFYRSGHVTKPATALEMHPAFADDGWCDAPADANYNRPVKLPCAASHETLQRADNLYDRVIVLDWNIRPRKRNGGSAIFLHIARPGFSPTEGCVAVAPATMRRLLRHVDKHTVLVVHR